MQNKQKHILVIEDEPDLGKMFQKKLENNNFKVTWCADGIKAITVTQETIPDMVLLDLLLPHIEGYTILKTLKSNPLTEKIPVFIISNLGEDAITKKEALAGAEGFFIKANTSPREVVEAIQEYFRTQEKRYIHNKEIPVQAIPNCMV